MDEKIMRVSEQMQADNSTHFHTVATRNTTGPIGWRLRVFLSRSCIMLLDRNQSEKNIYRNSNILSSPVPVVHVGVVAEEEAKSPEQAPDLGHTELLLTAARASLECQPGVRKLPSEPKNHS